MTFSKTLKGRYFDFVGHFFSIYCVYKIFIVSPHTCTHSLIVYSTQCIINIIFERVGKVGKPDENSFILLNFVFHTDPVTRGLMITVSWLGINVDVSTHQFHVEMLLMLLV